MGYYGPNGAYYNLSRTGKDVSRGLVISSLETKNLHDDISDIPIPEVRKNLIQWLSFFLNKYPQLGVAVGRYFNEHGEPSREWLRYIELLGRGGNFENQTKSVNTGGDDDVQIEDCLYSNNRDNQSEVLCKIDDLVPKIIRHRGRSHCACVNEDKIFSINTREFTVVHFDNCSKNSSICWPMSRDP
jgi:hypothetical protein